MEGEEGNTTGYIGTNVEKTLKNRSKCNPEGRMSYVKSSGSQNFSFFFLTKYENEIGNKLLLLLFPYLLKIKKE